MRRHAIRNVVRVKHQHLLWCIVYACCVRRVGVVGEEERDGGVGSVAQVAAPEVVVVLIMILSMDDDDYDGHVMTIVVNGDDYDGVMIR